MLVKFGHDDKRCSKVLYTKFPDLDHATEEDVFDSVLACEEGCLEKMRFLHISLH